MKERFYASGRTLKARGPLALDAKPTVDQAHQLGISMDSALVGPAQGQGAMYRNYLETELPGVVRILTQVRRIDALAGILVGGSWEDEVVTQKVASAVGKAELYGDATNIPLANYRSSREPRHLVRFEQGFQVGKLEEARQSREGFNDAEEKRRSVIESLDYSRNSIGFNGFNGGENKTYGLLNDPNLPPYAAVTTPWKAAITGAWSSFGAITADIATAVDRIIIQSGGNIGPDAQMVFALPLDYIGVLQVRDQVSAIGQTVGTWVKENYPGARFEFVPEFQDANGGANVAYFYVESLSGFDDADSRTLVQLVPEKYRVIGSEQRVKGYIEDAVNALGGIFVLRPWAFSRITGI